MIEHRAITQVSIEEPATVADIQVAWRHNLNMLLPNQDETLQCNNQSRKITNRECAVLTANILQHPVKSAVAVKQFGRFVLVDYEPRAQADPDIVICFDHGAKAFHEAVLEFQGVRNVVADYYFSWKAWYRKAMEAASKILSPLALLNPTKGEAYFVLDWLMDCVTHGRII